MIGQHPVCVCVCVYVCVCVRFMPLTQVEHYPGRQQKTRTLFSLPPDNLASANSPDTSPVPTCISTLGERDQRVLTKIPPTNRRFLVPRSTFLEMGKMLFSHEKKKKTAVFSIDLRTHSIF